MRARVLFVCLVGLSACACGGESMPRALRERGRDQEVQPFREYAVPGLSLHRITGAVPDHGWAYVVGVDEAGRLVEGPALMRRFGALAPAELARRALDVLVGMADAEPLVPTDAPSQFAREDEWALVREPRREGDRLVFFLMRGEMRPTLTEVTVETRSFGVTYRSADDLLLAAGRTVPLGPPTCAPLARCGCFVGCSRFAPLRVPGSDAAHYQLLEGPREGTLYVRGEDPARTGSTCRADTPGATCDPALVPTQPDPCGEACPPSEATFRCEALVDGCRRVEHPTRAAATR